MNGENAAAADDVGSRAMWLQEDASYLYREAARARESGRLASGWIASLVQVNAAHSSKLARQALGIES